MKIAVTFDQGKVFQHFGHTEQFKIYETENGKVVSSRVISTDGQGHGALAAFLAAQGVEALICGGIGGGAQMALAEAGIRLYGGVQGAADEAVAALLDGTAAIDTFVLKRIPKQDDFYHLMNGKFCGEAQDAVNREPIWFNIAVNNGDFENNPGYIWYYAPDELQ